MVTAIIVVFVTGVALGSFLGIVVESHMLSISPLIFLTFTFRVKVVLCILKPIILYPIIFLMGTSISKNTPLKRIESSDH